MRSWIPGIKPETNIIICLYLVKNQGHLFHWRASLILMIKHHRVEAPLVFSFLLFYHPYAILYLHKLITPFKHLSCWKWESTRKSVLLFIICLDQFFSSLKGLSLLEIKMLYGSKLQHDTPGHHSKLKRVLWNNKVILDICWTLCILQD